jgi:hypothetical protein
MNVIARVRITYETDVHFKAGQDETFRALMQKARDIATDDTDQVVRHVAEISILHLGSEGEE